MACPIDKEDFGTFLGSLLSSSNSLLANGEDKYSIRAIPIFSLEEFWTALKAMKNLRSAEESGLVVEVIKYANETFKSTLITCFKQILIYGSFDKSWFSYILQMIPKDGDLQELAK